jgi:glucosamine-6-phosphate deaminase
MKTRRRPARSKRDTTRKAGLRPAPARTAGSAPSFPEYLRISAADLGKGQLVKVRRLSDAHSLSQDLAEAIASEIREGERSGRGATLIVPVGPVDHFPILARLINEEKLSCHNTVFINMDEYLTDDDQWLSLAHPLSFRGYMERAFYRLLEPSLAPPLENRVFPDPASPGAIAELISSRNGIDACFGGIGINGHLAFNEPPEPGVEMSREAFADLTTRILDLSRETRTINAVTVGGEIGLIPKRAITIGLKEILASRRLRFYCNRPWQSAVIRRALHGPLTPACPASYFRVHPDACVTITDFVATPPNIQLR